MAYDMRLSSILSKVEVTEGTDTTPVAGDGFFATVGEIGSPYEFLRNENKSGLGSQLPGVVAARRWQGITVATNLRGSGVAYASGVKPKADALLRMGGFLATGSFTGGAEKWDYTFRSSGFESFSNYIYRAGKLFKVLGGRYSPSIAFALGGYAAMSGQLQGLFSAPTDGALVAVTGEPSIGYPVMLSSLFQISTENYAAKHGEITLDCGRQVGARQDGTSATGYSGIEMFGERAPILTITAEQTNEAGFGFWTKAIAGTQMDLTFGVGSAQYNRIKVNIPALQFESLAEVGISAQGGGTLAGYRATCLLVSPGGLDNEVTITFD